MTVAAHYKRTCTQFACLSVRTSVNETMLSGEQLEEPSGASRGMLRRGVSGLYENRARCGAYRNDGRVISSIPVQPSTRGVWELARTRRKWPT